MKRKYVLLNISLIVAVWSSILFQSIHSFEHLVAEFTTEKCEHSHETGNTQITHQHHNFDHCFSCDFNFSTFIATPIYSYGFFHAQAAIPYFAYANEAPDFPGANPYSPRGPPHFIVSLNS